MARRGFVVSLLANQLPSIETPRSTIIHGLRFLFLLLSLLFLSFLVVNAQEGSQQEGSDQGIKPYGAYHGGDIDSISMVNGSLTLHIPLISYPQRGGKLSAGFSLVYNNPQYSVTNNCSVNPPPPNCVAVTFVYHLYYPASSQGAGGPIQVIPDFYPSVRNHVVNGIQAGFEVYEFDGAVHRLGATSTSNSISMDATGYKYIDNQTSGMLVDRQGTQYSVQYVNSHTAQTVSKIEDSNGNIITPNLDVNGGTQSWTDTLGRTIPWLDSFTPTSDYTGCTGSLPTSSANVWTPPGPNGGASQFKLCYASFPVSYTPPDCLSGCTGISGNFSNLQSIALPNGTAWTFEFDTTGSLSMIGLPTGGSISYTWNINSPGCFQNPGLLKDYQSSAASRAVNANDGTGGHTWNYALTYPGNAPLTVVTDPNLNDVVHTGTAIGGNCSAYETELDRYSGSHTTGTVLKKTVTTYNSVTDPIQNNLKINIVPLTITNTDMPTGETSQIAKTYDSGIPIAGTSTFVLYGNVVTEKEYDFGNGAPGSLLRTTATQYLAFSNSNYLGNNLLDLVSQKAVFAGNSASGVCGSNGAIACSAYGYDESSLQSSSVTEQHVAGETYAGNQTSVKHWLNGSTVSQAPCSVSISNGYSTTSNIYFDTGEVQKSTDPCGYATSFLYSSTYYGAFPTTATNALSQNTTYAYDFDMGTVTSVTDPNLQVTTKTYDAMARLSQVNYADGGKTTYCYTDTGGSCAQTGPPYAVVVTKAITTSPSLNKITTLVFDGLGRTSQTQLNSDSPSTTYILTTYDALGRKSLSYNPTRCSAITTNCGETTWGYTTTNYDALSRVTSVLEQDGSTISTNYAAFPCTTVTDETGRSRKSCVDGIDRMTGVWEDPGTSPHLNYETDYLYDVLGNLTSATQKAGAGSSSWRTRTFIYDSLSHLTSATNPESGAITYAYDADGNVITKTAPKHNQSLSTVTVTTTSTYDKLNRLTKKSYSDGTATAQFGYDGVAIPGSCAPGLTDTYPAGYRTSMCDGSGGTSWSHDQLGRVVQERRTIGGAAGKYVNYLYNLDGSLSKLTTPPLKTITYTQNGAGRMLSAVDSTDSINFATSAAYAPSGGLTGMVNGLATPFAGFTTTNAYNQRLQPILLSATINAGATAVFRDCFDFHLGTAISIPPCSFSASSLGDNGNVYQVANTRDTTRSQNFIYDSLNRIQQAYSSGSGTYSWGETFSPTATNPGVAPTTPGIDGWANLTNRSPVNGKTMTEGLSCSANTSNQLASCYGYDAAGNMTSNGGASYIYDAENRLTSTSGYTYVYDGDGERVEKCGVSPPTACPTSGTNGTLYWKGTGSDTLDESDLSGNALEEYIFFNGQRIARRDISTNAMHYYFSDHLGSHGVVENATGTTCEQDIDYYPYGGAEHDYCPNVVQNYKFTGKERDSESGLDNFGARYMGSSLGRFMSPDPMGGHLTDPQTLNRYAYVRNNPLSLTDPTGLDFALSCTQTKDNGSTCQSQQVGTDKNGNAVNAFVQGTSDANGKFTSTQIGDDGNGGLVDKTTGTGAYSANVTGGGVQFSQDGGKTSTGGVFVNGTDPTHIQGSGDLSGFSFTFTNSKLEANQTAAGTFTFGGTEYQAGQALMNAGFVSMGWFGKNKGFDEFRSTGSGAFGENSAHFNVEQVERTPSSTVPTSGKGNMHFGEHFPLSLGVVDHILESNK